MSRRQVYDINCNFYEGDYIKKEDLTYKVIKIDETYLLPLYILEDMIEHTKMECTFIDLVGACKVEFNEKIKK